MSLVRGLKRNMDQTKTNAIVYRQKIIQWRDRHSFAAMTSLNRAWQDFRPLIVKQIEDVGLKEALASPNAFIRKQVDPKVSEYFTPLVADSIDAAKADLQTLFSQDFAINTEIASSDEGEEHFDAALDVLRGIAPLAGGIVVGAAIPSMAVVSGTTLFGVVATSSISLPVVFGGLAIAGAGVATGAINTSKVLDKARKRMLAKIDRHIAQSLLNPEFDEKRPAILARLLNSYKETAAVALGDPV